MKRLLLFLLFTANVYAEPRIHRVEPMHLQVGQTTEVLIHGDDLGDDNSDPKIWANFPSTWELIEHDGPKRHRRKFRVTVPADAAVGPVAIRAWRESGLSPVFLLLNDKDSTEITTLSLRQEPIEHAFEAEAGKPIAIEVWSNRLNLDSDPVMSIIDEADNLITDVDDDEVIGADPYYIFNPIESGKYRIKLNDIQWRSPQAVLRLAETPLTSAAANIEGVRETTNEPQPISIDLAEGDYLSVTPTTREIGSPAMLMLDLHNPEGGRLVQSGSGNALDEVLRRKINKTGIYQLYVRELLKREALPYTVDISTTRAPFEIQVDRPKDWEVVKPGGEFKMKFRATRFDFNDAIQIETDLFGGQSVEMLEKKGDVEIEIKVPNDIEPNSLIPFRLKASSGKFTANIKTSNILSRTPAHIIAWPDGLDGQNYLIVDSKK